jgi:hypothetical protein
MKRVVARPMRTLARGLRFCLKTKANHRVPPRRFASQRTESDAMMDAGWSPSPEFSKPHRRIRDNRTSFASVDVMSCQSGIDDSHDTPKSSLFSAHVIWRHSAQVLNTQPLLE